MQIDQSEIDTTEEAGTLDGNPVKLMRTRGGFWLATGRLKGRHRDEVLSCGSHPAIVKYNIEKQHPSFQPCMMKSEILSDGSIVDMHSHFLSDDLRKSGHDLYSIQNHNNIEFQITKKNIRLASINSSIEGDSLMVKKIKIPLEFSNAMAAAVTEKSLCCKVPKIKIEK